MYDNESLKQVENEENDINIIDETSYQKSHSKHSLTPVLSILQEFSHRIHCPPNLRVYAFIYMYVYVYVCMCVQFCFYAVQACFEGNPFKTVPGPFKLFWQCMRAKPGFV